jgi:hypothetical protein
MGVPNSSSLPRFVADCAILLNAELWARIICRLYFVIAGNCAFQRKVFTAGFIIGSICTQFPVAAPNGFLQMLNEH